MRFRTRIVSVRPTSGRTGPDHDSIVTEARRTRTAGSTVVATTSAARRLRLTIRGASVSPTAAMAPATSPAQPARPRVRARWTRRIAAPASAGFRSAGHAHTRPRVARRSGARISAAKFGLPRVETGRPSEGIPNGSRPSFCRMPYAATITPTSARPTSNRRRSRGSRTRARASRKRASPARKTLSRRAASAGSCARTAATASSPANARSAAVGPSMVGGDDRPARRSRIRRSATRTAVPRRRRTSFGASKVSVCEEKARTTAARTTRGSVGPAPDLTRRGPPRTAPRRSARCRPASRPRPRTSPARRSRDGCR
jgi:hypothetical protein